MSQQEGMEPLFTRDMVRLASIASRAARKGLGQDGVEPTAAFEPWVKPEELAAGLGVSRSWVYRNLKYLPHHRFGKYIRFRWSEIERWVEESRNRPWKR